MSLKFYLLLLLTIPIALYATPKDGVYESRIDLKQAQRILSLQKRNLKNMKDTLSLINEKNAKLKELAEKQKKILRKTKKELSLTKTSLDLEKKNLIHIQKTLNHQIVALKKQQLILDKKLQKISTAKEKLSSVNLEVEDKSSELVSLRESLLEQNRILKSKDKAIELKNIYIFMAIVLLIIFALISLYIHKLRVKDIKLVEELENLSKNLERKVVEGVEKQKLLQKQKASSMDEMMGNIAHQWRQPLNAIGAICTHLSIKATIHQSIDLELLKSELANISNHSQYLSKTIDTFRDFIKGGQVHENIVLQDELKQAFTIVSSALETHFIKSIDKIDYSSPVVVSLVRSELPQVIINIVNNAKDAIVEKKIENPTVEFNLITEVNKVTLTIEDNAGGIPDDIILKIFDPYFTTKQKSEGTGLGLHMSYKIITQSLKGDIYVHNTDKGAKFFIELPLISE